MTDKLNESTAAENLRAELTQELSSGRSRLQIRSKSFSSSSTNFTELKKAQAHGYSKQLKSERRNGFSSS
uniref:Bm383 n=1 Tax=Brugia malayi TaxID=6279 RepID=A0A0I9R2U5_BRUMA|nr:Bm383 [Brugia malayi]